MTARDRGEPSITHEVADQATAPGAKLLDEAFRAPIRLTFFADPEGNKFQLATWQTD